MLNRSDLQRMAMMGDGPRLDPEPPFVMPEDVPVLDESVDLYYPPLNHLDMQAREYLRANPRVWALFYLMVRELVNKKTRFSMKMLVEVARWQHIRRTFDPNQNRFKLSNSYTSYIVRLLVYFNPEVQHYVTLKEIRGERDE